MVGRVGGRCDTGSMESGQAVTEAGGFWSGPTPWWATVVIGLLATLTALFVMRLNNRAVKRRDAAKVKADDQRRDRVTDATVQGAADNFITSILQYYETWLAFLSDDASVNAEVVAAARA